MSRLQPITDQELGALIKQELSQSGNWAGDEWREAIREALDYFNLRPKGDEVPGRSQIQSGDVADMIDHIQAELQPMYNVDTLWEVKKESEDDESAAEETEALNWYWRERCRGAEKLDEAVQDGLATRNGYLKVWFEESAGLPYRQELVGDELQINAELAGLAEENEIRVLELEVEQEAEYLELNPIVQEYAYLSGMDQMPQAIEVSPAIYEVEIEVIPIHQEVIAEAVAPEDSFTSRDAVGSDMQKPRFWAHRRRMTRQDVKGLGFWETDVDKMQKASDHNEDIKIARLPDATTYRRDAADPDGELVDLFECYYKVDRDRDGIPEMWKVFTSSTGDLMHWDDDGLEGDTAAEMVRVRPVASGSPMKVAHRHQGRSIWDKEKPIEDWGRALIRQMVDNLAEANNTTTVYSLDVADEEIEETEVGRSIRTRNPGADVVPFKHNNIVGDSLAALQYKDKLRRERGGSAIDVSRENAPVQQAAHSTERIMSAMERIVGMYARNFANNLIRDTGVLLHQQMQLLPGKITFEVGNEWREVEPRYWVQRNRLSVNLGKTEGEKQRELTALTQIIGIQREDAQGPFAVLSDPMGAYEARIDLARCAGLQDPGQYFVSPESPEGQAAAQRAAQMAEQERMVAMMQQRQLYEMQIAITAMQEETKRAKNATDSMSAERDRLADLIQSMTKLEVENNVKLPFGLADEEAPGGLIEAPEQVQ